MLDKKFPSGPKSITFLSDRRSITLDEKDILYVESIDTITMVHTSDGAEYKNSTPISQWESLLGAGFLRIHRSFVVNRAAVTSVEGDALMLGDIELPVSRKYKSRLKDIPLI